MRKRSHIWLVFIIIIYCIILSASLFVNRNGGLHPETEYRIPWLLDQRSFMKKIFDFQDLNKKDQYQARELSYVFDITDAYFLRFSAHMGFPHFFSLIHYVSIMLISLITIAISVFYFKQRKIIIPFLLGCVFLTSPAIFLNGYFFRTAKILLALSLTIFISLLIRILMKKTYGLKILTLLFTVCFIASLFDRQGFYIVCTLCIIFGLGYGLTKNKDYLRLTLVFFSVSVLNTIYNLLIGPILIYHYAGYWPDFSYQTVSYQPLLTQLDSLQNGLLFFFNTFSFLWGNVGNVGAFSLFILFLFLLLVTLLSQNYTRTRPMRYFIVIGIVLSFFSIIILYSVMILTHAWLMWPDVQRGYYSISVYVIIIIATNYIAMGCQRMWNKSDAVIILFLLTILFLNINAIPVHDEIIRHGHLSEYFSSTSQTILCIKQKNTPITSLTYPNFYNKDLCEALRK